jgi:hypothetical protein
VGILVRTAFAVFSNNRSVERSEGWLPPGNECCVQATLIEHLTLEAGNPCLRRYLATPLDEIILSTSAAELSSMSFPRA